MFTGFGICGIYALIFCGFGKILQFVGFSLKKNFVYEEEIIEEEIGNTLHVTLKINK
jgi:hypothetical protein